MFFDACKSTGLRGAGEVCARDAYYVGIVLDAKTNGSVTISDKSGNELDYLTITLALQGDTVSHSIPIPVFAPGGIDISITGSDVYCIVYYAEQFGNHKRA